MSFKVIATRGPYPNVWIEPTLIDEAKLVAVIPTPDGWRCGARGCIVDYKHTHGDRNFNKIKKYHG